jgi:hypothetical protein
MDGDAMPERDPSFLQTMKAVLWAFLGIRRRNAHENDLAHLKPAHVIVMGIVLAAAFVLGLVTFVKWIVASQGA